MDALRQDLRFALRRLLKTPGFTAIAILSMALGIGVVTTVFGVLHGIVLRPFPFAAQERIVAVVMENPQVSGHYGGWSYPDYLDLRRESTAFEGIEAHRGGGSLTLSGLAGPERVQIDAVSAGLFPFLGVDPFLGRHFLPEEDGPDGPPVVLLGHDLWQRRFGGDPGIVGRPILAAGKPHQVVGVMPPGFEYPDIRQAWVPLGSRWARDPRPVRQLLVVARLRPGVSLDQARAEVSAIARRLEARHPETNAGWQATVEPLRQRLAPPELRRKVVIVTGAAVCVLLLACANIASLLLAEAGGRRRELAIRSALGAGRGRIVRQLLTENVLLALAGGALGVLLAVPGLEAAGHALAPVPFWMRFTLDAPVLLFALAMSAGSGLLFGIVPALQVTRIELRRAIKDGDGGRRRAANGQRLRGVLVIGEVAVALVLLIGTSLLVRSLRELRHDDPGYTSPDLLTLWTTLQGDAYAGMEGRGERAVDIARRVAAIPGVDAAAVGPVPLYDAATRGRIALEGRAFASGQEPSPPAFGITWSYFATLRIPLLEGRAFSERECSAGAPVAVVNRSFADTFFPGASAVGKRLRLMDPEPTAWMTIVGVSGDLRTNPWLPDGPQIFVPPRYQQIHSVGIVLRSGRERDDVVERVRGAVLATDPELPLYDILTMEEVFDSYIVIERTLSQGFALFGGLALLLAAIGIYGILSCIVSQRLHELGVRIALGAGRRHVLGLVMLRGMGLAAMGTALGIGLALATTRLLSRMLYGVSPVDPASFLAIPLLLLGVALAACWVPARKAMETDPAQAIRSE